MAQVDSSRGIWRSQPFYVRLNAGGLLVFALAALVTAVILELGGLPRSIVNSAGIAVPSIVIALLVLRIGGWTLTLAAIWAVLVVLVTLLFLPTGFSHINSFWDFAAALTTTVAVLAASIGGGGAFVQRRRGTVRQTATTAERRSLVGATAVVVVLLLLSGVLHVRSIESVSADAKAGAIAVVMKDTQFDPDELTVQAGQPAKLVVKNDDLVVHTFVVEELGIDEVIIGGSEKLIAIAASSPGSFAYVCEIFGHEAMKGTMVVQSAAQ